MIEPRLFQCSGATVRDDDVIRSGCKVIALDTVGSQANVTIRFENVAKVLLHHLSPRLMDLLEIASYVYTADCSTQRGTQWIDESSTEPWGRDFSFVISVRDPAFWKSVSDQIGEVLSFLSDDRYSFRFEPLAPGRSVQQEYLEFSDKDDWPFSRLERVVMFSGGLDSLAGVVESVRKGSNLVLVSHRPVATLSARQKNLFHELLAEFPQQLFHVPVWINKEKNLGREPTQRTRSFLYAALGTVVGSSIQAGGVRFFENGVVSLNLPVAGEVMRSRASRTTHPIALHLLGEICAKVVGRDFAVDNPYLFRTKTEVVATLKAHHSEHLIGHTCSCAHMFFKTKTQQHCGSCSQCIDRRFAIVATGLQAHDPHTDYEIDVFTGARKDGPEKSMAVDYTRHALELGRRSEAELAAKFNMELSRAARHEPKRSEAISQLIAMHKRHGETVVAVLTEVVQLQAGHLARGTIAKSSLLALALNGENIVQAASSTAVEVQLRNLIDKLSGEKRRTPQKAKLQKRELVLFAAILLGHEANSYCKFLQEHGITPKWANGDSITGSYQLSYKAGDPWRKKVQDEKTRARTRMKRYTASELATAFRALLPQQEAELRQKLSTFKRQ